jgi:DNA modification methylase
VAAERAGRRCFAMELDPVYCDVAVRRWEMATGKAARREHNSVTVDELEGAAE